MAQVAAPAAVVTIYSDESQSALAGLLSRGYDVVRVMAPVVPDQPAERGDQEGLVALPDVGQAASLAVALLESGHHEQVRVAVIGPPGQAGSWGTALAGVSATAVQVVDGIPLVALSRARDGAEAASVLWAVSRVRPAWLDPFTAPASAGEPREPAPPPVPTPSVARSGLASRARGLGTRTSVLAATALGLLAVVTVLGGLAGGWVGAALAGVSCAAVIALGAVSLRIWLGIRRLIAFLTVTLGTHEARLRDLGEQVATLTRTTGITATQIQELIARESARDRSTEQS